MNDIKMTKEEFVAKLKQHWANLNRRGKREFIHKQGLQRKAR